jgi:hypothetical protein
VTEKIDLSDGVTLTIFAVLGDYNKHSVVSVLDASGRKTLVTGDAETKAEKRLLAMIGKVDVYVIGRHGSEIPSSQPFLDEISSKYGLISSQGPNKDSYNNPDIRVLQRLTEIGTEMYATYRSGIIVAKFDGNAIILSLPERERITAENYKVILLKSDLRAYLSAQRPDLTVAEMEKVIGRFKNIPSAPLYLGNRETFFLVNEGFTCYAMNPASSLARQLYRF